MGSHIFCMGGEGFSGVDMLHGGRGGTFGGILEEIRTVYGCVADLSLGYIVAFCTGR